ncbi:Uncharacterized protein TCM_009133 [Theobroma cacao]|uniref:Uncharacterized protein n=1 Tax=Theobroma cacao TaxID=3641 RepID=A0A061E4R9_THECC|nr:Uncharacterized protein TCM_009133 [Theobroma cacao]
MMGGSTSQHNDAHNDDDHKDDGHDDDVGVDEEHSGGDDHLFDKGVYHDKVNDHGDDDCHADEGVNQVMGVITSASSVSKGQNFHGIGRPYNLDDAENFMRFVVLHEGGQAFMGEKVERGRYNPHPLQCWCPLGCCEDPISLVKDKVVDSVATLVS